MSIDKAAFACCSRLEDIELPPHADIAPDAFEETPWQEARDEVFQIRGSCLEHINNNTDPILNIPYGVTELAQGDWMSERPIMDEVSQETEYEEGIQEIGCGYKDTAMKRLRFPESTVSISAGINGGFWCTPNLERVKKKGTWSGENYTSELRPLQV